MMPFFSEMRMGRDGRGSGDAPSEERKAKLIGKKKQRRQQASLALPCLIAYHPRAAVPFTATEARRLAHTTPPTSIHPIQKPKTTNQTLDPLSVCVPHKQQSNQHKHKSHQSHQPPHRAASLAPLDCVAFCLIFFRPAPCRPPRRRAPSCPGPARRSPCYLICLPQSVDPFFIHVSFHKPRSQ